MEINELIKEAKSLARSIQGTTNQPSEAALSDAVLALVEVCELQQEKIAKLAAKVRKLDTRTLGARKIGGAF